MTDESRMANLSGIAADIVTAGATLDSRYSFTAQFLHGAAILARRAHEIEVASSASEVEEKQAEHCAYVVGAVAQSAAAIESEISEVAMHGPRHHLGSNGLDVQASKFLSPLAEVIDGEQALKRYEIVLHLLRCVPFDKGSEPYQSADLLVKLRNELIHYKSTFGAQMEQKRLFKRLEQLGLAWPEFVSVDTTFFPRRCLSASLAGWCVETSVQFINTFYQRLAVSSPLDPYATRIVVPAPRKRK